jgi:hypothetical protein
MEARRPVKAPPVPPLYWSLLSDADKLEYVRLSQFFLADQALSGLVRAGREHRGAVFMREVLALLNYIERSVENAEIRCIVTGLAVHGPFVCINTRALKGILRRCKSSINGLFRELGYGQWRARWGREFVMLAMPSLRRDPGLLRQWTIRQVADDSNFCFVSKIPRVELPDDAEPTDADDARAAAQPALSLTLESNALVSEPPKGGN